MYGTFLSIGKDGPGWVGNLVTFYFAVPPSDIRAAFALRLCVFQLSSLEVVEAFISRISKEGVVKL